MKFVQSATRSLQESRNLLIQADVLTDLRRDLILINIVSLFECNGSLSYDRELFILGAIVIGV